MQWKGRNCQTGQSARDTFRLKDTIWLKVTGWKKMYHESNPKKVRVSILIADKMDFKTKKYYYR